MKKIASFVIAAPNSGSGKTTVSLGLLRALHNRGLAVRPFKCGPDYIDTKFHETASRQPSVNLDLFLSNEDHVRELYHKYSSESDIALVEGVMGLFDGYDKAQGSSAQVAECLGLPVVLVVNAKATAYSIAPLLYGFKHFSDKIHIAGVIFNFVGSPKHYLMLKEACEEVGLPCLGYLPKENGIAVPSRHLGLSPDSVQQTEEFMERAAALVEETIDIDRLLAETVREIPDYPPPARPENGKLKIAVARDEAFHFMYHENLQWFKQIGEVEFFSPLSDERLPEADLIYLPGGYPELYLERLSANTGMREQVCRYAASGGNILAECGGMMYLCQSIIDPEGRVYPMAGVLDQRASMQQMKLRLGYRRFEWNGKIFKGHEFHYSTVENGAPSAVQLFDAKGYPVDTALIRRQNVVAGYTHLYWADTGRLFDLFKD